MRNRLLMLLLYPLIVLALLFLALRYPTAAVLAPHKAESLARLVDEAANVGLNGQPGTTISGRAGRAAARGRMWGCVLCATLDWISAGHCEREMQKEA